MAMKRMTAKFLISLLITGICATASASGKQEIESHARILDTARTFLELQLAGVEGKTEVRLGNLDRRLRLQRCSGMLEGYLPPGGRLVGNTSVGVRCNGEQPWQIFVSARVSLLQEVVVARGYLARGTILGPEHIEVAERDVTSSGHGYISDPDASIGMILRQPIQNGLVITPVMLTRPKLIRRGEDVVIISRTGNFEVRMTGSAMADGAEGERIRVRNKNSKRIIEGRVTGEGTVMVQM